MWGHYVKNPPRLDTANLILSIPIVIVGVIGIAVDYDAYDTWEYDPQFAWSATSPVGVSSGFAALGLISMAISIINMVLWSRAFSRTFLSPIYTIAYSVLFTLAWISLIVLSVPFYSIYNLQAIIGMSIVPALTINYIVYYSISIAALSVHRQNIRVPKSNVSQRRSVEMQRPTQPVYPQSLAQSLTVQPIPSPDPPTYHAVESAAKRDFTQEHTGKAWDEEAGASVYRENPFQRVEEHRDDDLGMMARNSRE